jgi:kynurenine formamidase
MELSKGGEDLVDVSQVHHSDLVRIPPRSPDRYLRPLRERLPALAPIPTSTDSPGIITADDVKKMVQDQGLEPIGEGDCVFLYTGHGDLWKNSEWPSLSAEEKAARVKQFTAGEPGYGRSACEYFAEQKIILTGGDTSANDAQPVGEVEGEAIPCHSDLQTRHGIWNIENLDFEPLLADGVYEFLFVWAPLKMVGATGSPGNPVALY